MFLLALGPILAVGHFSISIVGGLLGCPFAVPFIMCRACPVPCVFGAIRPWFFGSMLATNFLVGRAFCGLSCPFGSLQDLLHKSPLRKISLQGIGEKLKYLKYGVLIPFVWLILEAMHLLPGLPHTWFWPFMTTYGYQAYIARLVAASIVLAFSFFTYRPWCTYLCPIGAWTSVFNKFSLITINRDPHKCDECHACNRRCSVGLDVANSEDISDSADCIVCFECYVACKRNAVGFRPRWRADRSRTTVYKHE